MEALVNALLFSLIQSFALKDVETLLHRAKQTPARLDCCEGYVVAIIKNSFQDEASVKQTQAYQSISIELKVALDKLLAPLFIADFRRQYIQDFAFEFTVGTETGQHVVAVQYDSHTEMFSLASPWFSELAFSQIKPH